MQFGMWWLRERGSFWRRFNRERVLGVLDWAGQGEQARVIAKKSVADYCNDNTLIIPQDLYYMRDVKVFAAVGQCTIFYKHLEQDLVDIEFYTHAPCLVYIQSGQEIITSADNLSVTLHEGECIYLPKGMNLYSDYVNSGGILNAFLIFFERDVIERFLSSLSRLPDSKQRSAAPCFFTRKPELASYFNTLLTMESGVNQSGALLGIKLLELLHLLLLSDREDRFLTCLVSLHKACPERNIARLMDKYKLSLLGVAELATLSGRSLSSFNRDFKKIYGISPKQWITQQRLLHAQALLQDDDKSVADVANTVGYENVSHFIAAFKRNFGVTPKRMKLGTL